MLHEEWFALGVTPWVVRKVLENEFIPWDVSRDEFRLELLANALLIQNKHPALAPVVVLGRACAMFWRERKGLLGETIRYTEQGKRKRRNRFQYVELSEILGEVTPPAEDMLIRERMNELALTLLGDLGKALAMGCDMEQAATVCGYSKRTAYNRVDEVKLMLSAYADA